MRAVSCGVWLRHGVGIQLFENATRDVGASNTLAHERGRALALQLFVASLRRDRSPEFGECDQDEPEAEPMTGSDLRLAGSHCRTGHRDLLDVNTLRRRDAIAEVRR